MRSELALLTLCLGLVGCEEKPSGPSPSRFASVKKRTQASAAAFCDKRYPANGEGSHRFVEPPKRPFGEPPAKASGWTWLNVWATWCKPCVDELGVLNRWRDAFTREGLPVAFTLLSVDDAEARPQLEAWQKKSLPGAIAWLRGEDDLGPLLDSLGVERGAPIPIHALIDPKGMIRCVRVGAIHEENYGAARDLIAKED